MLELEFMDLLQREQRTYSGSEGCGAGVDGLVVEEDCPDVEADEAALNCLGVDIGADFLG